MLGKGLARRGDAILLCIAVAWAVNISSTKYALGHGFSPVLYAASRNLVGGLALAAVTYGREKSLSIQRRDLPAVLGCALLGISINQICLTYSLHFSGAVVVSLVFGMGPIATSVIVWLAKTESLEGWGWAAAVVSSAGVACVAFGTGAHGAAALAGVAIALGATLSWAGYSVILTSISERYSAMRLNAVMILLGSVPLVALAAPGLPEVRWSSITGLAWGCWLYGTAISYTVGSIAWTLGVRIIGASRAALYNNAQPFLGAILATFLLSEGLGLVQVLGGAMVAVGVLMGSQVKRRHPLKAEGKHPTGAAAIPAND